MAIVFATNVNVFTAPEVSALHHEVVSWAWRDGSRTPAEQRAAMEAQTVRELRWIPDAAAVAHAYHAHKAILPAGGALAVLRALLWTFAQVRRADRVLVSAPLAGVDRVLWLSALAAAWLLRRPLFVYSEVWIEPTGSAHRAARLLQHALRRGAARILVPGAVHREYQIAQGVRPERVAVIESIYGPRGPARRLLPATVSDRPFTFLYIGRLMPCKGLERLLRIFARLADSQPRVRLLVVAGRSGQYMGADPGYGARCRRLIAEAAAGTVTLMEHRDDVEVVYAQADALVMANVVVPGDKVPAESWGRVVEEALWHDVPVISTDVVPAALERVVPGVNGLVVPWTSDRALEDALAAVAAGL